VAREWGRIGTIGFGGPPTHIALLRRLCVEHRGWLTPVEFEDAVAACNLLPGPASTQLAIYCAWRLRRGAGALVGGAAFIVPGLVLILGLAALVLASSPPLVIQGAAAGAGAGVAAVAVRAGLSLAPSSRERSRSFFRWLAYGAAGAAAAATLGPWLVLVLVGCGLAELTLTAFTKPSLFSISGLAWVAFKVGALAYGGGFVIVPLMQADAVDKHHWLSGGEFASAVALGQVTPGPVVLTVAAVGYAAAGLGGGMLAAGVAFAPSFAFVLLGGPHFHALRSNGRARAFLAGAGPASVGAILGAAIPLAAALELWWQFVLLAVAAVLLLVLRRGIVPTLLALGAAGAVLVGTHLVPPA
jgi:chromate transporter